MAMLNPRLKGTPRPRACPVSAKTIAYMAGTDTQVHKTPGARPSQAVLGGVGLNHNLSPLTPGLGTFVLAPP